MYEYIVNPLTGKKVETMGEIGINIIKNYINQTAGGKKKKAKRPKKTKKKSPKTKHKKFPSYYGKREIIDNRLARESFFAKIIISIDSTGLCFSTLHNIPSIMIYSDELNRNKIWREKQNYIADKLGVKPVNIDSKFDGNLIKNSLAINEEKYREYKTKYLTSRDDKKLNYQILSNIELNNQDKCES